MADLASIDHIVVLMMENRSFDHYFGAQDFIDHRAIDGLNGTESNPGAGGVPVFANALGLANIGVDPPHDWNPSQAQWANGANSGFVSEQLKLHTANGSDVMGYYWEGALPTLYGLSRGYSTCDHWFASVMGPTWPNRFYLHAASSKGQKKNFPEPFLSPTIWSALKARGVSAKNYFSDVPWKAGAFLNFSNVHPLWEFFSDASAGNLPSFALIDPPFLWASDHPDQHYAYGEAFIATITATLMQSPNWEKTLFVVTYDEHGGFFDHVPPPRQPADKRPAFRQLGFRVPTVIAGPCVKQGFIDSTVYDHVSVIATVCKRFGLPALNARVAATNTFEAVLDTACTPGVGAAALPLPPFILTQELADAEVTVNPRIHPEMHAAFDVLRIEGGLPSPEIHDRRGDIAALWAEILDHGVRLGAVQVGGREAAR